VERRLAAILAADVVGYSRMIRADEEGTLLAFRALRKELIDPKIDEYRGRIVKLMGDGMLVEFASVVDAVACGVDVQRKMVAKNERKPDSERIIFRIGINLCDVVIEEDDIHGDGVNIATRLEALSEPGGMCISDAAHEQVRDRLKLRFTDSGMQQVKNIDRPVKAWNWTVSHTEVVPDPTAGGASLSLPEKPSIAVLPFDNMSGDAEQEFFADGMAEDIITALARMRNFFVIARNSSFSYRGKATDIRQVGRELGVRYVLEGSVRRVGPRVRITAQLIDAKTGNHVWAERYDRPADDIFAVQDEITMNVSGAIGTEIHAWEIERTAGRRSTDLASWERVMKAYSHMHKATAADTVEARKLCLDDIELSGGNSQSYAVLGFSYAWDLIYGWGEASITETATKAAQAGQSAISLDPKDELAHALLSVVHWLSGDHDAATRSAETAVGLNSNFPLANAMLGYALGFSGVEHHSKAKEHIDLAIRLGPRDIWISWPYANLAMLDVAGERYDEAIENARLSLDRNLSLGLGHRVLAAALALSGKLDEANAAWTKAVEVQPLDMSAYAQAMHRIFKQPHEAERYLSGLRLAGADIK
jgi:adenylate cyclase